VERENTLNALIADHAPYREGLGYPDTFFSDNNTAKDLYTGFIAFSYPEMNINSVAYVELKLIFP